MKEKKQLKDFESKALAKSSLKLIKGGDLRKKSSEEAEVE